MGVGRMTAVACTMLLSASLAGMAPAASAERPSTALVAGLHPAVRHTRSASGAHTERVVPPIAALGAARTLDDVAAAMRVQGSSLAAGGSSSSSASAAGVYEDVVTIADADGDKRRDLMAVRSTATVRYVALRGLTGKTLWRHDSGMSGYGIVVPLRLSGRQALLAITQDYRESDATLTIVTQVTALDLKGKALWTKRYEGSVSQDDAGLMFRDLAFPAGIAAMNEAAGEDLAVVTYNGTAQSLQAGPVTAQGGAASTTLSVVDGEAGTETAVVRAASAAQLPEIFLVGDLNDDRRKDAISVADVDGSEEQHVVGYAGTSGAPLWETTIASAMTWYGQTAGDTDADTKDDVLLHTLSREEGEAVQLLSGADGAATLRFEAMWGRPVADLNGDKRGDLQFVEFASARNQDGIRYTAVTGTGRTIYRRDHLVNSAGANMLEIWLGMVGDIDGDRRQDFGHEVTAYAARQSFQRGPVRTSDGRKSFNGALGVPLYGAVRGRGDDLVRFSAARGGVRMHLIDAANGKQVWSRVLVTTGGYFFATAQDLTGDRRAETVITQHSDRGARSWVLDGATAKVRWLRGS